jgi:hypothetical protein
VKGGCLAVRAVDRPARSRARRFVRPGCRAKNACIELKIALTSLLTAGALLLLLLFVAALDETTLAFDDADAAVERAAVCVSPFFRPMVQSTITKESQEKRMYHGGGGGGLIQDQSVIDCENRGRLFTVHTRKT